MSRILMLIVVVMWMCRSAGPAQRPMSALQSAGTFIGGLLLVVLFMGLWSRVLARHVRGDNLHRSLRRFHRWMGVARVLVPAWFGVAIFALGWSDLVMSLLGPIGRWPVELPGVALGTAPAFAAWMALWWAQFPADRALREQSMLIALDESLPVHAPPGFWSYFLVNFRLQVLFTIVPVGLIILLHDVASLALWRWAGIDLRLATLTSRQAGIELMLQLGAIALVVLFAPEILRRVLHTQPLPDSPLRRRLEDLCLRTSLRYRDILLWRTDNNMGNAAVMGIVPQMRYILLSDLLLETMTDRQIEAVFAHEIGHIKHWHMGWYVVLVVTLMMMLFGPGQMVADQLSSLQRPAWLSIDTVNAVSALIGVGGFFVIFSVLSRWFERQADVYAARVMEAENAWTGGAVVDYSGSTPPRYSTTPPPHYSAQHVGQYGAQVFASALRKVAAVNNIPISAWNFSHPSISARVDYLQKLSAHPDRTSDFDRSMGIVYAVMILVLLTCGAWVMLAWWV